MLHMLSTRNILVVIIFLLVIVGSVHYYIQTTFSNIQNELDTQIAETKSSLVSVAEDVYRSRANDAISPYVKDCTPQMRAKFDRALDTLNQLSEQELADTEVLFEACASYFADTKTATVHLLEQVYSQYSALGNIYAELDNDPEAIRLAEDWQLFISLENDLAKLLQAQLPLQKSIISKLREGISPSDTEIRETMKDAQELSESASVLNRQIDAVYKRLNESS